VLRLGICTWERWKKRRPREMIETASWGFTLTLPGPGGTSTTPGVTPL
jgi:hypothetical protein